MEGNLGYLDRLVQRSPVLEYEHVPPSIPGNNFGLKYRLKLRDNTRLVFGGDCFDKGPGDMRLATLLVDLKERYPDRVHLILGNRDINKMKFLRDLDSDYLKQRNVDEISIPFYIPANERHRIPTMATFLKDKTDSVHHRLIYLLKHTMGAPHAFELRRQEISELNNTPLHHVTDDQTTATFIDGIRDKHGFYRRYIEAGELAVCLGNTIFVHGAVQRENIGFVPSLNTRYAANEAVRGRELRDSHSVQEWVSALNDFKRVAYQEWVENPRWDDSYTHCGGQALLAYGHRRSMHMRTVVVLDLIRNSVISRVDPEVEAYLNKSGIARMCVGHKPIGDSPLVVRTPNLEVIDGDTSYSDTRFHDNRGVAASEVLLCGAKDLSSARIHGVLADGREIDFVLPPPNSTGGSDSLIGTEVAPGWWVKAKLKHSPTYVVVHFSDYKAANVDWDGVSPFIAPPQLPPSHHSNT